MALPDFLNDLNDSQREAVLCTDGPSLVIAGAGSGKTRVLTYKIAYLLTQGVKPWEIMALTFTNKAAKEMKERIAALVGEENARYLRMGTFHSVFASILRHEANKIGYNSNYTIYDEADSRSLIKSIVKEMGLDDKVYKPADIHCRISDAKNHLITARAYAEDFEALQRDAVDGKPKTSSIYTEYARRLLQSNAMDFDDLLLNIWMLFKNDEQARLNYSGNFRYILVDEYQDTNHAQQEIVFQLTSVHNNICVVGDDAQSIYGFRGANIDNILNFQHLYAGAKLFKLEQNYRSTHSIVDAANSLIHKNERQIHKDVYSMGDEGEPIILTGLSSDREEAIFVSRNIRERMRKQGLSYSDFAILYRTNYQSRTFEEEFMKSAMPYRIYGGMSFYQRKEIKDIIAYFRLVVNPYDEEALERIINYPARGIGNTTLAKLHNAARDSNKNSWEILEQSDQAELDVNKGTMTKLTDFRNLIMTFAERLDKDDAYTLGKQIIRESGISNDIYSGKDPEQLSRQEHLEEFLASMQEFTEAAREQENPMGLTDFLQDVSLLSDREEEDGNSPKITLMTIHSAKGLEFPCVYVVGMEENIFPSPMSQGSLRELEEERRLLYVAITRAERYCHLTYAKMRFRYGRMEWDAPSRFLRDIDSKFMRFSSNDTAPAFRNHTPVTQQRSFAPRPMSMPKPASQSGTPLTRVQTAVRKTGTSVNCAFAVGDKVAHDRFGNGVITALEGDSGNTKATVRFDNAGTKQLLLKFAKLRKI
jgi:DNA helicase-2/ATP-dependent DNA helicase PcrA